MRADLTALSKQVTTLNAGMITETVVLMVAPQRAGPVPQRLREHAVVSGRVCDALVEDRNVGSIVLFIERLKIDICGQRSLWSDRIEQGLHDHVGTTGYITD